MIVPPHYAQVAKRLLASVMVEFGSGQLSRVPARIMRQKAYLTTDYDQSITLVLFGQPFSFLYN